MKVFLVFILTETSLATNSYSFFFLFWSANYAILYILEMSRYINIVYMGGFFVLTYIERLFSAVCCFFSYISCLVNCKSWVSKFHHFFSGILGNCGKIYIWGLFKYFSLWKVHFQLSGTYLTFFIWPVNCLRDFFSYFFSQ